MLIREFWLISERCLQEEAERRAPKPVDDDDDIFGDAGTNYEPELPKSKASDEAAPAPAAGSYFDKKDEMADLPALPKAGMLQAEQESAPLTCDTKCHSRSDGHIRAHHSHTAKTLTGNITPGARHLDTAALTVSQHMYRD